MTTHMLIWAIGWPIACSIARIADSLFNQLNELPCWSPEGNQIRGALEFLLWLAGFALIIGFSK